MQNPEITENLKSHFLRLFRIALCDENFSELEMKMLYEFASKRNIPRTELDKILLNPHNSNDFIPTSTLEKVEYLYDLTQMIWIDGEVSADERITLEKYIKLFGFEEDNAGGIATYMIDSVQEGKPFSSIKNEII